MGNNSIQTARNSDLINLPGKGLKRIIGNKIEQSICDIDFRTNLKTKQFNILPFVIDAIGENQKIHKDIDELYQSRKFLFHKAAQAHEWYNHQIFTEGGLLHQEYCKKALGIFAFLNDSEDQEINEALQKIFKKGWKYVHAHLENNSVIYPENFVNYLIRKNQGHKNIGIRKYHLQLVMLLFMASNKNKKIIKDYLYIYITGIIYTIWNNYQENHLNSLEKILPSDKLKIKKLKNEIYEEIGVINAKGISYAITKRYSIIERIFLVEKLCLFNITGHIDITEKEIEELLYEYILENEEIEIKKATDYLIDAYYIRKIVKAYKHVKTHYFKNNKETMFIEQKVLENDLNTAKSDINIMGEKLKELTNLNKNVNKDKDREIKRLKKELAKSERNKSELNGLRSFIFNTDNHELYKTEQPYDLEKIKKIKAVVVGGHQKWHEKMKRSLPNFIFISTETNNFDKSILDQVEYVFIYTNYLSHSIYYRVINAIKDPVIITYLKHQDEEIVLQEIFKAIDQKK